jgi:imidazolonepropionase-like amidohydrolase
VTNAPTFFQGARILDVLGGVVQPARSVVIRDGRIAAVGDRTLTAPADAHTIDLRGMTLMPGLIDAHVHVTAATANFAELQTWSPTYVAGRAGELVRAMLRRGFTTVRDTGGADFGLADAVEEGYLVGPRLARYNRRRRRGGSPRRLRRDPAWRASHQSHALRRHCLPDGPRR